MVRSVFKTPVNNNDMLPRSISSRLYALFKLALRITITISLVAALVGGLVIYRWLDEIGVFKLDKEQFKVITTYKPVENSLVFDNRGEKIGEYFTQYRIFTPFEKIPPQMIQAIIAIEDKNFFDHHGVDVRAIMRVIVARLRGSHMIQGASTITQQVVRHFLLSDERTMKRKAKEIAMALALESKMGKDKIFEVYVNSAFLGNGAYGIGAAAMRYFNKPVEELNLSEMTLIAGLFQSPSKFNPIKAPRLARKRQNQVIHAMYLNRFISRKTSLATAKLPLVYNSYRPINDTIAPYFVDYVRDQAEQLLKTTDLKNRGLRIYTTLDRDLQKIASETITNSRSQFAKADRLLIHVDGKISTNLRDSNEVEAAMLVTDPQDGAILAMVGGRDYNKSQFNRTTQALRQPGSAFKPIIYSLALDNGYKWSDVLYVDPVAVGDYRPNNFSDQYGTETTLLRSFFKSLNTTTVDVGNKLGIRNIIRVAGKMGISSPLKEEAGILLGSSEVTMLDMAGMYGTFAARGMHTDLTVISRIEDRAGKVIYEIPDIKKRASRIVSEQNAFLMTQGMRAVFDHGTAMDSRDLSSFVAGKTGTTAGAKDNWFCGYSNQMVTIVWVGTENKYGFLNAATGASLALPLWTAFMTRALRKFPATDFVEPSGIVSRKVDPVYGNLDDLGVTMYFRAGQEPLSHQSDLKAISHVRSYRDIFE